MGGEEGEGGGAASAESFHPCYASAGQGFGSNLTILGADPRGECCPERPQSPVGATEGGALGMGGPLRTVFLIAVSGCSTTSSSLSKSTLSLPSCTSSPSTTVRSRDACPFGRTQPHHRPGGVGGPLKFTLVSPPQPRPLSGCRLRNTGSWEMNSGKLFPQSARCLVRQLIHASIYGRFWKSFTHFLHEGGLGF